LREVLIDLQTAPSSCIILYKKWGVNELF
jgi:hypothetical protein